MEAYGIKFDTAFLSHGNNISQKERIADGDKIIELCKEARKHYGNFCRSLALEETLKGDFLQSIDSLNKYVDFTKWLEKQDSFFNWRSDFAASVIPEYLYWVVHYRLAKNDLKPLYSTRASVVEVTLLGTAAGGWNVRRKNQDFCIGLRREKISTDGKEWSFVIPQIVFEVKTNIDINKLNGLDFSAERLKKSFPAANYFLLTETIDFSLNHNYAAGSIDEIYVGRKQVRSQARRKKEDLKPDVFAQLLDDVEDIMKRASIDTGHVYDRLECGKLIHVD